MAIDVMAGGAWWQAPEVRADLEGALAHLNSARQRTEFDFVFACDEVFKGLNRLSNALSRLVITDPAILEKDGDGAQFGRLLLELPEERQRRLLAEERVTELQSLSPILSHWVLSRSRSYRPGADIDLELEREAGKEHGEFSTSLQKWRSKQGSTRPVVRALARLLYVVRSNIAHGWKTPHGPDLVSEARDRLVCERVLPVLEQTVEAVLAYPSARLVSYGTLSPGEPNAGVLRHLSGEWESGCVRGEIIDIDGLPALKWLGGFANAVDVQILTSSELPDSWVELDRFEGDRYRRVLCTVERMDEMVTVANVYATRGSDRGN